MSRVTYKGKGEWSRFSPRYIVHSPRAAFTEEVEREQAFQTGSAAFKTSMCPLGMMFHEVPRLQPQRPLQGHPHQYSPRMTCVPAGNAAISLIDARGSLN